VKVISDQSMKTVICFPYILYVLDKRSVRVSHFITVYSAADYIVLALIIRQGEKDSRS
jgi:hypothetical protein